MSNKMETMNSLLPKFRFPEFQSAGAWEEKQLSQIAMPVSDKASDKDNDNILTLSGEYGLVLQSDYFGKKIAGDNVERYIKILFNDFVYNDRTTKLSMYGSIKRLSKYESGIVSPIYKCFRFSNEEIPSFWDWYFESGSHEPQLHGLVNEGARAGRFNISIDKFLSTSVWSPESAEQQKIADCLSSLDDLITAQSEKVEALQAYKKGLMQNLFPAEGESLPRLRFPEFESAGEWEKKTLGDVSKIYGRIGYRGYTVEDIVKKGEGAIALSPSNINNEVINIENSTYISWYKYEESPEIKVENGDILFVKTGSTYGKTALVVNLTEKATVNPQVVVIKEIGINNVFLGYVVSTSSIKKQVEQIVVGGAVPTMSQKEISKMKFMLPSTAEQQRIAELLAAIDEQISAQGETVERLKSHKRGLMQGLFPSVEEV